MKNIIKTWILFSVIMLAFTQGSIHKMDTQMNVQSSSCHNKAMNIQIYDTCEYICSLVFFHKNEISLNILSPHSLNVAFSDILHNLNTLKPFKPPI